MMDVCRKLTIPEMKPKIIRAARPPGVSGLNYDLQGGRHDSATLRSLSSPGDTPQRTAPTTRSSSLGSNVSLTI